MSESLELGLPGVRTGLVVAPEPVIEALGATNAVVSPASNSMGPALVLDLVQSGELVRVSREIIRPFYEQRSRRTWLVAGSCLRAALSRAQTGRCILLLVVVCGYRSAHRNCINDSKRRVLWLCWTALLPRAQGRVGAQAECIRISYAAPEEDLQGLALIGAEVRAAYGGA